MILHVNDFDEALVEDYPVLRRPKGNPGGRQKKIRYRDVVCAFDIETTTIDDINFMYIWQFQFGTDYTVYGRTWDELRGFFRRLGEHLGEDMIVIYVHNLPYEWQYLKSLWCLGADDVFAVDERRVIKFTADHHFEFRCSYALTNMSLNQFTKKMMVEHGKLSGAEYDYSKIRFPWTPLSKRELEYCVNDVRGLTEAVMKQMERDGDNLYTIPLTSTGYPRREMKHAMRRYPRERIAALLPDYDVYLMLKEAFRGGNTHASRFLRREDPDGCDGIH